MRPMKAKDVIRAIQITSRYPEVHGAPVHLGDPLLIGISDLSCPDYGDAVDVYDDEIPVFLGLRSDPASRAGASQAIVLYHACAGGHADHGFAEQPFGKFLARASAQFFITRR